MFSLSFKVKAGAVLMLALPDTDLFHPHRTVGFLSTEHAVKLWLFNFILYVFFYNINLKMSLEPPVKFCRS